MVETKILQSSSSILFEKDGNVPCTPQIPFLSPLFEIPHLQLPISSIFEAILRNSTRGRNRKKKRIGGSSTALRRRAIACGDDGKGSKGKQLNSTKQTKIRKKITDAPSKIRKSRRPIYTLLKLSKKALKRWNNVRVRKCL